MREREKRNDHAQIQRKRYMEQKKLLRAKEKKHEIQAQENDQFNRTALRSSLMTRQQNHCIYALYSELCAMKNQPPPTPLQLPSIPEIVEYLIENEDEKDAEEGNLDEDGQEHCEVDGSQNNGYEPSRSPDDNWKKLLNSSFSSILTILVQLQPLQHACHWDKMNSTFANMVIDDKGGSLKHCQ